MADYLAGKKEGAFMAGGLGRKLLFLSLATAFSGLLLSGCKQQEAPKETPVALESVKFCRTTTVLLPMVVAEKQGFFSEQGLAVTARVFITGQDALSDMLRGECDFATSAEPPVVEYALQRDDFRIISALQSSENMIRIVARADRGIAAAIDLRGKRIGTTAKGTSPHCFVELFLAKHGLTSKEVVLAFMKPDELLGALISGQVDAIAMPNKVIVQAQHDLGDRAVLMEEPGLYRSVIMLLALTDMLKNRPAVAERFLRALAQADDFIRQRPDEAQVLVLASQQATSNEIKYLLENYHYQLSLDHAMLIGLEDAARWTLSQPGDSQRIVPNFLNLIAAEPLRTVKPDAVRLEQ